MWLFLTYVLHFHRLYWWQQGFIALALYIPSELVAKKLGRFFSASPAEDYNMWLSFFDRVSRSKNKIPSDSTTEKQISDSENK